MEKIDYKETWKTIVEDFLIKFDKEITNGELKGKQSLVFQKWLSENYEVPEKKLLNSEIN